MKKTLYALVVMSLVLSSCSKEPQPMSKQEMARKIDSVTRAQIIESDANARKDLERRIKIEVKVKADSILDAKLHPKTNSKSQVPGFKSQNTGSKSLFPNRTM